MARLPLLSRTPPLLTSRVLDDPLLPTNREARSGPAVVLYQTEPLPVTAPGLKFAVEASPMVPMVLLTMVPLLISSVLFVPILPMVSAPPRLVEPPPLNVVAVLSSALPEKASVPDRDNTSRRVSVFM